MEVNGRKVRGRLYPWGIVEGKLPAVLLLGVKRDTIEPPRSSGQAHGWQNIDIILTTISLLLLYTGIHMQCTDIF